MKIYNMTKTEHLRKRLTTDRLARQQTTKFRDFSPISTREAITASSVANAPCGGNKEDDCIKKFGDFKLVLLVILAEDADKPFWNFRPILAEKIKNGS